MIEFFASFGDIFTYPLFHISPDPFTGILFYLLLVFFVFNFTAYLLGF